MLYSIKNKRLKYWQQFDELGDKGKFEFEHSPCACGSVKSKLIANTTRHRNKFKIVQCRNCGTLRIDPYLTRESIDKYYSETYGRIKRKNVPAEKLYKKQAKSSKLVFSLISKFINKNSKILDFGGGAGGKMSELLAQGYEVYLKETDKNYYAYGISRGLKPFSNVVLSASEGSFAEAQDDGSKQPMKFGFIILSRVLEHMSQPIEFLEYLKGLVAEDGCIYIEVPWIENARDNYLLNEFHIAHKFYFTSLSLKYILALAGLKPVHKSRNLFIVKRGEQKESAIISLLKRKNMRRLGRQVINRAALTNLKFALGFKPKDRSKN